LKVKFLKDWKTFSNGQIVEIESKLAIHLASIYVVEYVTNCGCGCNKCK
jgi:hypothetical protein